MRSRAQFTTRTGFPFSVIDPSFTGANNYGADLLPNPTAPITNFSCNSESHFGQAGLNGNPCAFAAGFAGVTPGTETDFGV